jgi:small subunit ribosomal protein S14
MRGKMLFDRVRRTIVANAESSRLALRYITHDEALPIKTRMLAQFKLAEIPAATSVHRMTRRCIITGRGRAVLEEFNINRMRFREMALRGQLLGVQKSSW